MARVELASVSLSYTQKSGVFDVSLAAGDGEFVALLGPSGSGKTTLLRLVGGFLRPDEGSITIGEEVVSGKGMWTPPERRSLGMVFQQHAVWPHRSVARNVEYPLKLSKVARSEREERVRESLDLVGLSEIADRAPSTLSGGQRQRVALARALVARPAALLLDEPFASLDAALRERLRAELALVVERTGVTVLHVTHDRTEALSLADRVAVVRDGRLEQVDPPEDLYRSPRTPFVAGFVSDATLVPVESKGERRFVRGEGEPVEFEVGEVISPEGPGRKGVLAVRPQDVGFRDGAGAEVKSIHFMGDFHEVRLDWAGRELRTRFAGESPPRSGESVSPIFSRAILFPE